MVEVAPVNSCPDCRKPLIVGVTAPITRPTGGAGMLPITAELLELSLLAITLT